MCLQNPSRRLIDIYLVLSVVLCLIFIHHRKLLHVKCEPLDFDSSQRHTAGISQIAPVALGLQPAQLPGEAIPVAVWYSGLATLVSPFGPKGPDPKCIQQGIVFGMLVNVKDSRGGKMGEASPLVADTHWGPCQLLNSILALHLQQGCALSCSFGPSDLLCTLLSLLGNPGAIFHLLYQVPLDL